MPACASYMLDTSICVFDYEIAVRAQSGEASTQYVLIKALSHDLVAPTGAADGRRAAGVLHSGWSLQCQWRKRNNKKEECFNIGVWIQNAMQSSENH